jgi:hypothetical protein
MEFLAVCIAVFAVSVRSIVRLWRSGYGAAPEAPSADVACDAMLHFAPAPTARPASAELTDEEPNFAPSAIAARSRR